MPRNYIRTTNRAEWTEDELKSAVALLNEGHRSANSIAKEFHIPLRTLLRRARSGKLHKGSLGPTGCLGIENEQKLVQYIQKLEKAGYAATSKEIRHLAFTFAEKNNVTQI